MKTPDLDKAFPKTPSYVHRCVLAAFEEGERRADRRKRRLTAFCCAAAMLLVFVVGGFAVSSKLLSSPDSILPPLSAASASPLPTATSTPDPAADGMEWYDPGTVYAVSAVRLYVDNLDECYGQTDAESCAALSDILKATLTAQTELTAYMSASFTPPLVLEIDYTERDARAETGTACVRLNWNSGLNLFYTNGQSWALENGCDELFAAMNVDTDALSAALTQAQTATQAPTPELTDAAAVTPEPTAAATAPELTAAPTDDASAEIAPLASTEPAAGTALEGEPFAPEDIHDLTRICLYIGDAPYFETDDPNVLATLEKMLSGAEATQGDTACPYGPVLYLARADGVTGWIEPAYDSCTNFRAGGTTYDYSADSGDDIWSLVGVATDELIDLMTYYGKDMVFVVPGSSYYHVSSGCEALSYEMSAYSLLSGINDDGHLDGSIIREKADLDGQTPCAYCAQTVYATNTGLWYHADSQCSGMEGADEYTVSAAQVEGKTPCPICMDGTTNVFEERALVFLVPVDMGGANRYHGDAGCPAFRLELLSSDQSAQSGTFSLSDLCLSAEEAEKMGASPCAYCIEKSVYATPNGTWYHTDPTCSGMMNARDYTVMQAENEGKTACPVCCGEADGSASYQSKIRNKNANTQTASTPAPQNESDAIDDAGIAGVGVG